jgi:hypothetical protein
MPSPLLTDLDRFLGSLEHLQGDLELLFTAKSRALREAQRDEIVQLAREEGELIRQLQTLVGQRMRLLNQARQQGVVVDSLHGLIEQIDLTDADRAPFVARIRAAEMRAAALRHESWIHWIVSHRCYNHYTELLELIAHGGTAAPTYSNGAPTAHSGGVILDASI